MSRSLRVQSVLYRPEPGSALRLGRGLQGAVALARSQDVFDVIDVALGDCSPFASVSAEELRTITAGLEAAGVRRVTYDFFSANLGSARGHNRLLEGFDEDFVLFLNPDVFASPYLLAELGLLVTDSRIGVVEARQVPLEHPKTFDPDSGDTSWASTACALVRRAVIDDIGGFDADSFFLYCDDVDFSWRARLAGYRVVHQPTARIFHDKRLTTDGTMAVGDAELYYAAEAALMLAWKYSRADLAEAWLDGLAASTLDLHQRAVQRFTERRRLGTLPEPIDPDGTVAEFHGYDFAVHRFSYSD